jgi:hypothetical protein
MRGTNLEWPQKQSNKLRSSAASPQNRQSGASGKNPLAIKRGANMGMLANAKRAILVTKASTDKQPFCHFHQNSYPNSNSK